MLNKLLDEPYWDNIDTYLDEVFQGEDLIFLEPTLSSKEIGEMLAGKCELGIGYQGHLKWTRNEIRVEALKDLPGLRKTLCQMLSYVFFSTKSQSYASPKNDNWWFDERFEGVQEIDKLIKMAELVPNMPRIVQSEDKEEVRAQYKLRCDIIYNQVMSE